MTGQTFGPAFGMASSSVGPTPEDELTAKLARSSATTGIVSGMEVKTQPGGTTIDVTPGTYRIVDRSDPANVIVTEAEYPGATDYKTKNKNGEYVFMVQVENPEIVELEAAGVDDYTRNKWAIFGGYEVFNNHITSVNSAPMNITVNPIGGLIDAFVGLIGPGNIIGNSFTANGTNMSIDNSGGNIWAMWSNYHNDRDAPCTRIIPSVDEVAFLKANRVAFSKAVELYGPSSIIDPNNYDDGTGLHRVPTNAFTVQVIYITPAGSVVVAYGQETFDTMENAKEALSSGTLRYEEIKPLTEYVRRNYLIVREGINHLNSGIDTAFVDAGKFRGIKSFNV